MANDSNNKTPEKRTTTTAQPRTTTTAQPRTSTTTQPRTSTTAQPRTASPANTARETAATAASTKPRVAASTPTQNNKPQAKPEAKTAAATNNVKANADGTATATGKLSKKTLIILIVVSVIFITGGILGIVLGIRSCSPNVNNLIKRNTVTVNQNSSTTRAGASYENLGAATRVKTYGDVRDEGLTLGDGSSAYPTYGKNKNLTDEEKALVLAENDLLCARPTTSTNGTYDMMDKDGYLYNVSGDPVLTSTGEHRRLYKHTASVGLYGGDVADSEPGVIKGMTFSPRSYSSYYNVTGLYAPAGEVIKIQISEAQMEATGGLVIHIGQALYNGQSNNIWAARNFNRMPVILNTMNMTKQTSTLEDGIYTCYVGSFLGGPIYIRDESVTFSVVISGAVNYEHYILGVTTEKDFETYRKSSAPYFDLEVWESGVLHSGPRSYAAPFNYEQLSKAAVLWEKISIVSTKVTNQGIVFIYDPFVAAGAAVAFPGRRSVNCPSGWMSSSLNYEELVNSGAWGNMHEYHHNFQSGWGFGYTGEVTNNALNLVSYSLFTNISSKRGIGSYGSAGLSGWNTYTIGSWTLNRVNNNQIGDTNGLAVYGTLLHNLGQDMFIKSKASGVNYLNKWAENTHLDFSYYAGLVQSYSNVAPSALNETDYHAFVPVSSVYQVGRSYMYDGEKRYIETMQPYTVPVDKEFTIDLRPYTTNASGQYEKGSIVIGKGLSYKIKKIDASALGGKLTPTSEPDVYTYKLSEAKTTGKIIVTLEIIDSDGVLGGRVADDVDLVLQFRSSHESSKLTLQRTVYSYEDGAQPESAVDAYNSNYAGNKGKKELDNYNHTQNSNTDVWLYEENNLPAGQTENVLRENNSVIEVKGKILFPEEGKYRLTLRARWNAALFISFDGGKTFIQAAHVVKPSNERDAKFYYKDGFYYDLETSAIKDPDRWLYFKSVLITAPSSYMGLGYAKWEVPMYTTTTETDEDGNTVTHYFDGQGNEVTAEEANNTAPKEPTDPNRVTYLTAYRNSYDPDKAFESDYFYKKEYNLSYHDDDAVYFGENQTYVSADCPSGWGGGNMNGTYGVSKMFDGQTNTSYISQWYDVSAEKPLSIVAKLDEPVTANYFNLVGPHENKGPNWHMPLAFEFYGSMDGEQWELLYTANEQEFTGTNKIYPLGGNKTLQYYKIVVTRTSDGEKGRVGINRIRFLTRSYDITLTGENNNHKSPDDPMFNYRGSWSWQPTASTFGHVNVGGKDATVDFKFEGTRFMINTSYKLGNDYEVYIDGVKTNSITVKKSDAGFGAHYISPELKAGKHTVIIRSLSKMNIESIALY